MFLAFRNCGGVQDNGVSSHSDSDSAHTHTHRPYIFFSIYHISPSIFQNICIKLGLSINKASDFSHCFRIDGEGDSSDYECDSGETQSTAACLAGCSVDTDIKYVFLTIHYF